MYSSSNLTSNITINYNETITEEYSTTYNYTIKVTDLDNLSYTTNLTINYFHYHPPQINKTQLNQTYTIHENETFLLKINATDIDNETLTFYDNTPLFDIDQNGTILFTPSFFDSGNYTINISVKDPENYTDYYVFNLKIIDVNRPPYFINLSSIYSFEANKINHLDLSQNISDPDNDTLTLTTNISTINVSNYTLEFFYNSTTIIPITLYLSDSKNTTNATITLNITPDITPPEIKILSPTPTTYYTTSINFLFTTSETLKSCALYINDVLKSSSCSNKTLTLEYNTYTLKFVAEDMSNNTKTTQLTFTIKRKSSGSSYHYTPPEENDTELNKTNSTLETNNTSSETNITKNNETEYKLNTYYNPQNKKHTESKNKIKPETNKTTIKKPELKPKKEKTKPVINFFISIINIIKRILSFIF